MPAQELAAEVAAQRDSLRALLATHPSPRFSLNGDAAMATYEMLSEMPASLKEDVIAVMAGHEARAGRETAPQVLTELRRIETRVRVALRDGEVSDLPTRRRLTSDDQGLIGLIAALGAQYAEMRNASPELMLFIGLAIYLTLRELAHRGIFRGD